MNPLRGLADPRPPTARSSRPRAGHSSARPWAAATAEQVKQAMLDVVQNGSRSAAAIAGVKVAGKTSNRRDQQRQRELHVRWICPYDTPTVAIAVVIEQNAKGEESAAAVGGQVLRAALATQGL
ncbi:MAG: penicillin-binding transpeptidase domain-containing protein [Collinsella sp.]